MPPLNVGLTGNIGSGKSVVAQLFVRRGAALIDADALAHAATRDPQVLQQLEATFGGDLIVGGALDRARLAALVFEQPEARAKLNAIVHPWVASARSAQVAQLLAQQPAPQVIVHDVPLLFETGLERDLDKTVVVDAPLELRVARVMARSGLSDTEVRARDAAQMPLSEKVKRADFVIDNSGGLEQLEPQVERIWRQMARDK